MLPFLRPGEVPAEFEPYFSKSWQELVIVSLHNFVATVLAIAPLPAIAQFDRLRREAGSLAATAEAQQRCGPSACPPTLGVHWVGAVLLGGRPSV
jgi:hypothetical protein